MGESHWLEHLAGGTSFDPAQLTSRRSLPAAWAALWSSQPERPALWVEPSRSSGRVGRWMTNSELDSSSRRAAMRLRDLGVEPGQRVVLCAGPSQESIVANLGVLRSGAVLVPANPASTEPELLHVLRDCEPVAAVVEDPEQAECVSRFAAGRVVVLDPTLEIHRGVAWAPDGRFAEARSGPREAGLDSQGPGDPALVMYTSGTTGVPKGALLTHGNVLANAESLRLAWRWDPDDRLVSALPLFHGHGLCVALYGTLLAGGSIVVFGTFDVDALCDAVATHHGSLFFGVPTMFFRLASSPRLEELGKLRLAVSGSAALAAELHRAIREGSGLSVLERYGLTETLMAVSNPYDGERRPGTVGFPLPGVEVRLAPARDLDAQEILVRGPSVIPGYWRREDETAGAFDGSWFRTGDLGEYDDAGYLQILGRSKELVISGGFNVYPAEVEEVLVGHPAVAEVAVTGTPSLEWGELVTAWVVAEGRPPPVEELMGYASERLAAYKRPRLVHFVDSLPRNAMGKVMRGELR